MDKCISCLSLVMTVFPKNRVYANSSQTIDTVHMQSSADMDPAYRQSSTIERGVFENGDSLEQTFTEILNDGGYQDLVDELETAALNYSIPDGHEIIVSLIQDLSKVFETRLGLLEKIHRVTSTWGNNGSVVDHCCVKTFQVNASVIFGRRSDPDHFCHGTSPNAVTSGQIPTPAFLQVATENAKSVMELLQQFIVTDGGILALYPATEILPSELFLCNVFELRARNYFVGAAGKKHKSLVLLIDTSIGLAETKVGGTSFIAAVSSAISIFMAGLGPKDKVAVVTHPYDPVQAQHKDCFLFQLTAATPSIQSSIKAFLSELQFDGRIRHSIAFNKSFEVLRKEAHSDQQPAILFFTGPGAVNHSATDLRQVFNHFLQNEDIAWANEPILMIFGLAPESADFQADLQFLKSSYPSTVHTSVSTSAFELRSHAAVYYRQLPFNVEQTPYLTTIVYNPSTRDDDAAKFSYAIPVFKDNLFIAVVGLDIPYPIVRNVLTSLKHGQSRNSYTFVVDQVDGSTIFHPLYNGESSQHIVNIKQLETSPGVQKYINAVLDGLKGEHLAINKSGIILDEPIVSPLGDPFRDGVKVRRRDVVYYCGNMHFTSIRWGVCYVQVVGDTSVDFISSKLSGTGNDPFLYQRTDLFKPADAPNEVCSNRQNGTFKDQPLTILSPAAFLTPSVHVFRDLTVEDVMLVYDIINSNENNTIFNDGVLFELEQTNFLNELWTVGQRSLDVHPYSKWRYVALAFGSFRIYPGPVGVETYEFLLSPWYLKAFSHIDSITVSPPRADPFQNGLSISIMKAIPFPEVRQVFGVLGVDVSLSYVAQLITRHYWKDCSGEFTCFLVDTSGYLVFHQEWFGSTVRTDIVNRHIIGEEPNIAEQMIANDYINKSSCINREQERIQYFYRINLTVVNHIDDENAWYKAVYLECTNIFLFQRRVRMQYRPHGCYCSTERRPRCTLDESGCECPCFAPITLKTCGGAKIDSRHPPCFTDKVTNFKLGQWKIADGEFPPCTGRVCPTEDSKSACQSVSQCSWCDRRKTGKPADNQFCGLSDTCPDGVIGGLSEGLPSNLFEIVLGVLTGVGLCLLAIAIACVWRFAKRKEYTIDETAVTKSQITTPLDGGEKHERHDAVLSQRRKATIRALMNQQDYSERTGENHIAKSDLSIGHASQGSHASRGSSHASRGSHASHASHGSHPGAVSPTNRGGKVPDQQVPADLKILPQLHSSGKRKKDSSHTQDRVNLQHNATNENMTDHHPTVAGEKDPSPDLEEVGSVVEVTPLHHETPRGRNLLNRSKAPHRAPPSLAGISTASDRLNERVIAVTDIDALSGRTQYSATLRERMIDVPPPFPADDKGKSKEKKHKKHHKRKRRHSDVSEGADVDAVHSRIVQTIHSSEGDMESVIV